MRGSDLVMWEISRPARILFVDSEDRCRAPAAAALANEFASEVGLPIVAESAGVTAAVGERATYVLRRVAGATLDLEEHRARQLTSALVRDHDLVVCMQHRQVSQVQTIAPGTLGFTFAYGELADLAEAHPGPGMGLAMWLPMLHRNRKVIDLREHLANADATSMDTWLAEPGDVADPRAHLPRSVRRMLRQLDSLTGRLLPYVAVTGGILPPVAPGPVRRPVRFRDDEVMAPA